MPKIIVLDAGILGALVHKNQSERTKVIAFLDSCPDDTIVVLPEIADYEVRRSLLKIKNKTSVSYLDDLPTWIQYDPITTAHMRRAAEIWAKCRQDGFKFCDDKSLDGDCILIAQAEAYGPDAAVLTTNPNDISRFVKSETIP